MIVTVEKLKQQINTSETTQVLEDKLRALELSIRAHTNNNFQVRNMRTGGEVKDGKLIVSAAIFRPGDTVQISESPYNDGVYTVECVEGKTLILKEDVLDDPAVLVTLVRYPADVQQGVINLMRWEQDNRDRVGVASETISRHSVTYFAMDGDNTTLGYPKALTGFLKPYQRARF